MDGHPRNCTWMNKYGFPDEGYPWLSPSMDEVITMHIFQVKYDYTIDRMTVYTFMYFTGLKQSMSKWVN